MRRKPTELHKLQGTFKPSRHAPKPAAAPRGVPAKPKHLSAEEAAAWAELAEAADVACVLTTADAAVLEVAAMALAEMRRASELLRFDGLVYRTKTEAGSEMVRPHPAQAIYQDAQRRLLAALAQLGLTPTTRGKAEIAEEPKGGQLLRFIAGAKGAR